MLAMTTQPVLYGTGNFTARTSSDLAARCTSCLHEPQITTQQHLGSHPFNQLRQMQDGGTQDSERSCMYADKRTYVDGDEDDCKPRGRCTGPPKQE